MRHFGISHYFAELDQMHMLLTVFGWCRGKGPHPRSIDAANVNESTYTHNADLLVLFLAFVRVTSCVESRLSESLRDSAHN
jgi:hypothetical protein